METFNAKFKKEEKFLCKTQETLTEILTTCRPVSSPCLPTTDPLQNPSLYVCSYMKVVSQTNQSPYTQRALLQIFRKRLYA